MERGGRQMVNTIAASIENVPKPTIWTPASAASSQRTGTVALGAQPIRKIHSSQAFATPSVSDVHSVGDLGHTFCRARLVPVTARCSADTKRSYDLIAALDCDATRKR